MFLIMFAAVVGGVATAFLSAPMYGPVAGLMLAPLGGSTLAVVAAGYNAWRTPGFDDDADRLIVDLRAPAGTGDHSAITSAADAKPEAA